MREGKVRKETAAVTDATDRWFGQGNKDHILEMMRKSDIYQKNKTVLLAAHNPEEVKL